MFIDFRTPLEKTVEQARNLINGLAADSLTILDVREKEEYERAHIPGSKLIPLGDLPGRMGELDPEKPVIVYCRSGNRSNGAAAVLMGSGFREVYNLAGGMLAWNGEVATGAPSSGLALLPEGAGLREKIALAWIFEEGNRRFYVELAETTADADVAGLFDGLAEAELNHKRSLGGAYQAATGDDPTEGLLNAVAADGRLGGLMEGGVRLDAAIDWARGKDPVDRLELAMALEANAYELYREMAHESDDETAAVFNRLAEEEWDHLRRMGEALGKMV